MEHKVERGTGKFEGEPCYAEHYWDAMLDGGGDGDFYDGDTPVSRFAITAEDAALFPCCLDAGDVGKVVLLWESDQGFVFTRLVTADEADAIQAECEAQPRLYSVVVGNIGTVYAGDDEAEANRRFDEYAEQSRTGYGRAAGESVVVFCDGEIIRECEADADDETEVED